MRRLRVNWCRSCGGGRNFGDQLSPVLLERAGVEFEWSPPATAEVFGVGSILSKVPPGFAGTIYGTGLIREGLSRDLRRARVLAVRGVLTRDACRLGPRTPLGDPGILVSDLLRDGAPRGGGGVVVVPHYVDQDLARRHPEGRVVAITTPPAEFVEAVAGAELVVSSSLHGLITADALGVPHLLDPHPAVIGGLWKFRDYASAFGEGFEPGVVRLTSRERMSERQDHLRRLLSEVAAP